jgi:GGDEF domain-containing protein
MSVLKRSIFGLAIYLAAIFVLAQFDYSDSPIIDFAKYFYFIVMVAVPVTVFFPLTSKVSAVVPLIIWGSIYFVMLQTLDRTASAPNTTFPIILLEFILLMIGVWMAYQLADGISHAESVMSAMALSAFPNRTQNIAEASEKIKVEITRSRRYHRPLGLLVLQLNLTKAGDASRVISSIQHEISSRFSFARIGQVVDEHVRQTDMVFHDKYSRLIVLCPETNNEDSRILAARISEIVYEKTGVKVEWGFATFPDDALNFDDLVDKAVSKLLHEKQDAIEG